MRSLPHKLTASVDTKGQLVVELLHAHMGLGTDNGGAGRGTRLSHNLAFFSQTTPTSSKSAGNL